MFSQGLIARAKSALVERAGADVTGSTKFKLKSKKGKVEGKVDMAKERSKIFSQMERYGKILSYHRPKKVRRTEQEQEEAKRIVLNRNRNLQKIEFAVRRRETTYIKLRQLAFEELPTQSLKDAASVPDLTTFPQDTIYILNSPPLEEEEVFGDFMKYGERRPDDL